MDFTQQELDNEVWKDIPQLEGWYQVSNLGRVRSLDRIVPCGKYGGNALKKGNIKKLSRHKKTEKYLCVRCGKQGKTYSFLIHRLVATVFIDNPLNKPAVNHKDCNPENNRVENLEWVTHSENLKHAWESGLRKPNKVGKDGRFLTKQQIEEMEGK